MPSRRLDEEVAARGLLASRSRARDAIVRGCVSVDGRIERRPGRRIAAASRIAVDDPAAAYVSRGALKLIHGLDTFGLSADGRAAVDIGASTGGFTQVLLERGARSVTAIDVGHDQLAPALRRDDRVRNFQGLNARDVTPIHIREPFEALVADVSFISLATAIERPLTFAAADAWLLVLLKPQFEVGREALPRTGVVSDQEAIEKALQRFEDWLIRQGWQSLGITPSPIDGADGNREFLVAGRRSS